MEQILEKNCSNDITNNNNKKGITILGFSIWRIFAYFIVYSVVGYVIETIFGLCTKGVIESRKSFLYGPFCSIYGIGAVIMIIFLQYFKKNNNTLFFGGFLIGSIVEYLVSLIGELILHVRWWDYSHMPLNINGRVCVFFSLFWGFLAIYLITYFNPKVDKFIKLIKDKVHNNILKIIIVLTIVLMFLDCVVTGFALKMFFTRLVINYNLELQNVEEYLFDYEELYKNQNVKKVVDKYFNDNIMLKTFPNLKVTGKDGEIIYVSDVFKDITPYYIRLFTPKVREKESLNFEK